MNSKYQRSNSPFVTKVYFEDNRRIQTTFRHKESYNEVSSNQNLNILSPSNKVHDTGKSSYLKEFVLLLQNPLRQKKKKDKMNTFDRDVSLKESNKSKKDNQIPLAVAYNRAVLNIAEVMQDRDTSYKYIGLLNIPLQRTNYCHSKEQNSSGILFVEPQLLMIK